jgi:hypothetical protein
MPDIQDSALTHPTSRIADNSSFDFGRPPKVKRGPMPREWFRSSAYNNRSHGHISDDFLRRGKEIPVLK